MQSPARRLHRSSMSLVPALICLGISPHAALAASKGDPFEGVNRRAYAVHQTIDHLLLGPAARLFRLAPAAVRRALHNVLGNLKEPSVAANDLLQGHPRVAGRTFVRFAGNTTFGIAGLFDVATKAGLPHHDNGFADTLGRYGIGPGPYLFIPLIGPTTVRDLAGGAADEVTDPLTSSQFDGRITVIYSRAIVGGLLQREEADKDLKAIDAMSTDSYATLRSLYMQSRAAEISTVPGSPPDAAALPLPDFDPVAPTPAPTTSGEPDGAESTPAQPPSVSTPANSPTDTAPGSVGRTPGG
jgi:phospholipid-binding lipoprotein MlaA